ncbi:pirin family protein [Methylomonas sp. 11b]|uniref:pirin family protein n=1 Tax=Methylomonas sp. 11b TaxID=1168169 RepID=UPI00047E54D4|nr:pirin family protein [Methylomonas sp. 11b]
MLEIRPAHRRGSAQFDWLFSRHTFSFGNYYDPQQSGFSDLLVINEDIVQPGKGFGTHPHRDMEIFTYVIDGALAHKDSMDNGSVIEAGDVQLMTAGTGVTHSEFNHSQSELVHFLQIWLVPNSKGVEPRYQQSHFSPAQKQGRLALIISPDGAEGSLSVYQDVRVYAGCFDVGEQAQLTLADNRYAYVHLLSGTLSVNGTVLHAGDGARIRGERLIDIQQGHNAEVLVFDLRPHEKPSR